VPRVLAICPPNGDGAVAGISIDGWNVDFRLVDREGRLIWHPVSYRDRSAEPLQEAIASRILEVAALPADPLPGPLFPAR